MNNYELELKIQEILDTKNFFDMMEQAVAFEKEYKQTQFFKNTKMPLQDVLKYSKAWYAFNFDSLAVKLQTMINELNFDKIQDIINQFGNIFDSENKEVASQLEQIKNMDFKFLVK